MKIDFLKKIKLKIFYIWILNFSMCIEESDASSRIRIL